MTDPRFCRHEDTVPVETAAGGVVETVARLCVDCREQLPTWHGCPACVIDEVEIRTFGDPHPIHDYVLATPCKEHNR